MSRLLPLAAVLCAVCLSSMPAQAQFSTDAKAVLITEDLEPVIHSLYATIEKLSDYRATKPLPPVYQLPQHLIEEKVCDEPCVVYAAYVPREGIYLAGNLDPVHEPLDRAALLHELVHYLQQGHPKFDDMQPCERERMKEQEAYAIQNAYLGMIGQAEHVVFYDGDFDCDRRQSAQPQ